MAGYVLVFAIHHLLFIPVDSILRYQQIHLHQSLPNCNTGNMVIPGNLNYLTFRYIHMLVLC